MNMNMIMIMLMIMYMITYMIMILNMMMTMTMNMNMIISIGEMMPKQLWDTTMDPKTRTLKLVSVEDAAAADRMFSVLMGDNVQPRKEFITANAGRLSSSDLDF